MPRDPEEETIQTTAGETSAAQEVTGEQSYVAPPSREDFDARQRAMSARRSGAGLPATDDSGRSRRETPQPDVPETRPGPVAPLTGREGRY